MGESRRAGSGVEGWMGLGGLAVTARERWQAVLNHQKPDRIPTDYWATEEVTDRLKRELGCGDDWALWKRLEVDRLAGVGPRYVGPVEVEEDRDMWGVRHRWISYGDGVGRYREACEYPLAEAECVEEMERYRWPSADWFDCSDVSRQAEEVLRRGYPLRVGGYEPFLQYCHLRGMERAMMDLGECPEIVDAILDRIVDFYYRLNVRMFEIIGPGRIDVTYVAEDFGTQESLLMSEAMVDRFLKPKMKRMIELAHQFGIKAFHHSDGAIRPLIEGMIAIGIDVLNPIQWRCRGMDRQGLKRDFGDRLVFHGGMDNQQTLPFGRAEDVRKEVLDNLRILGAGGGYILAPCHNLQPITPTENILTMYHTAAAEGWL
jgi:uroporphyrinogen decarboxylase